MSGQSITDRVMAAKHSIAGQGLAKAVHKSTTEEIMGPKRKHLDCWFIVFWFNIKSCNYYLKNHAIHKLRIRNYIF